MSKRHKSRKELSVDTSPSRRSDRDEKSDRSTGISDDKLEDLMREWSKVKIKISELEDREKSIKTLVTDIMKDEGVDSLYTDNYKVTRRTQRRSTVSQKDLPEEVWRKYSKTSEFSVFYLKKT
jgi:predicted phage-related endonuclease